MYPIAFSESISELSSLRILYLEENLLAQNPNSATQKMVKDLQENGLVIYPRICEKFMNYKN